MATYLHTSIYYFDASDAAVIETVPDNWTNDANSADGSITTYAEKNSNTVSNIYGDGTNAPATGGTIHRVRARAYIQNDVAGTGLRITDVGGAGNVGEITKPGSGVPEWTGWTTLTNPTWTWAVVQALRFQTIGTWNTGSRVYRFEIEVSTGPTTLNGLLGAETGGLEELNSVNGTTAVSSAQAHGNGTYSYVLPAVSDSFTILPFANIPRASGDGLTIEFWMYVPNVSTSTTNLFRAAEDGNNLILELSYGTSGQVILRNATSTTIYASATGLIQSNTWHNLKLFFENTASGAWAIDLDGTIIGSGSGEDFTDGLTLDTYSFLRPGSSAYIDDIFWTSGAVGPDDFSNGAEVVAYRSTLNSATPDFVGSVVPNGTPNTGVWADTQQVPFNESNEIAFTTNADRYGGVVTNDVGGSAGTGGPRTDTNITGTVVAHKGVFLGRRSNGSGTSHYLIVAKSNGATISNPTNSYRSAELALSTVNEIRTSLDTILIPSTDDWGEIGAERTAGGRSLYVAELLYQVLWNPPESSGGPVDTVGASTNTSTVTGLSEAVKKTAGSAEGTSAISGAGAGIRPTEGTSDGTTNVVGISGVVTGAVGSSDGTSVVSGSSSRLFATAGSSTASSTVSGLSEKVAGVVGASSGSSTVDIRTSVYSASDAAASGSSTVAAVGAVIAQSAASVDGTSSVSGTSGVVSGSVGSSSGTSTSAAESSRIVGTVGVSAPIPEGTPLNGWTFDSSTVPTFDATTGYSFDSTGASAYYSVEGRSASIRNIEGASSGSATVSGQVTTVKGAVGTSDGTSALTINIVDAAAGTVGNAAGTSTVLGVGAKIAGTVGASAGASTVSGNSAVFTATTGSSTASSTVSGLSAKIAESTGATAGTATSEAISGRIIGTVYNIDGTATSAANAASIATGTFNIAGTSSLTVNTQYIVGTVSTTSGNATLAGAGSSLWNIVGNAIAQATSSADSGSLKTTAGAVAATSSVEGITPTVYELEGFRFRFDDGSESSASWRAAQDIDILEDKLIRLRLRTLLAAIGNPAGEQVTLQYKAVDETDSDWRTI